MHVGHIDVAQLQKSPAFEVKSIHIHPQYNNRDDKPNYDNDIALIKLSRSITFDANVMPLCLPPANAQYPADVIG